MADGKKKQSAAVRTRVVTANDAEKPAKKTPAPSAAVRTDASEPNEKSKKENVKKQQAASKKARGKDNVGYFKGAWLELKQVRWPDRKATWGMTLAVILFTAFFVILVLLLDALFQYLFDLIIT